MKHLLWLIPLITALMAMQWPELQGVALVIMLGCGVAYFFMRGGRPQAAMPLEAEQKRDIYSVQRDIPPGPG